MILMQPNSESIMSVSCLVGSIDVINEMTNIPALVPFDERVVDLLNDVSRELLGNKKAKSFSDVVTFGFWIRKASLLNLKERFLKDDKEFRLGKGVVFHIAPSNVPVNFAYSLVSGLITGNANIVRVPSKDFEQVRIIVDAFNKPSVLNGLIEDQRPDLSLKKLIAYLDNSELPMPKTLG